ncbi:MAG: archaemetzincin family Zn-dependent metalloprotease [Candidatus Micrarchaeota archaeon]
MLISVVLVERTVPGFNGLLDAIGRTFSAQLTTAMIDFPLTRSFRASRKQFDAEVLLRELRRLAGSGDEGLTIFIIREDIFAGRLSFVFGLASKNACVLSTARLDPRFYGAVPDIPAAGALFKERIVKEAVHELGHCMGLPHCDDKKCVMVFSDSIVGVDRKGKEFCNGCQKVIKRITGK